MSSTQWGMNTDFEAVFTKLLLPTAKRHNLAKEQTVKRVFVFSHMQSDAARMPGATAWGTVHHVIKRQFKKAGCDLPELVYWNLAGGRVNQGYGMAAPVEVNEEGVPLMNSFSGSMLRAFVRDEEEVEAEEVGKEVVKEWDNAVVELEEAPKKENEKEKAADKMKKVLAGKSYAGLKVYDRITLAPFLQSRHYNCIIDIPPL